MGKNNLPSSLRPIGIVMTITSVVAVVSSNGNKKILRVGDYLYEGDKIVTGLDGKTMIGFADGSELVLGDSSEVILNSEFYNQSRYNKDVDTYRLFKKIHNEVLTGKDPYAILEDAKIEKLDYL